MSLHHPANLHGVMRHGIHACRMPRGHRRDDGDREYGKHGDAASEHAVTIGIAQGLVHCRGKVWSRVKGSKTRSGCSGSQFLGQPVPRAECPDSRTASDADATRLLGIDVESGGSTAAPGPPRPAIGVTSNLHSTVPEIERHVEPHGDIVALLAMRFKKHSTDHTRPPPRATPPPESLSEKFSWGFMCSAVSRCEELVGRRCSASSVDQGRSRCHCRAHLRSACHRHRAGGQSRADERPRELFGQALPYETLGSARCSLTTFAPSTRLRYPLAHPSNNRSGTGSPSTADSCT
jgi:hypothetical protein